MERKDIQNANNLLFQEKIGEAIALYENIIDAVLKRSDCKQILQAMPIDGLGNIEDQKGYYQFDIPLWYSKKLKEGKLKLNPFQGLALCFSHKVRVFQGRVWYNQKLQSHPNIYQLVLGLAHCLYNSDLIDQSFKLYIKATNLNQFCDKGFQGLANICFYKLNDLIKARQYAQKALACNPCNIHALIIEAFTETNDQSRLKRLSDILQLQPQIRSKIYHLMGVVKYEQGQIDPAVQLFQKSLDQQKYISPILSLANIAILKECYSQAEMYARQSLQLEGANLLGMVTLGAALIYLEQLDQSIQWLYGALQVDGTHYLPHFYLGVAYLCRGDYEEAQNWFIEAQQLHGASEEIDLSIAACKTSLGFYGNAYQILLQYSKRHPKDMLINYNLGCLQFQRKKYNQALEMMMLAFSRFKNEPTILFMIGCSLLNLGRDQEAISYFLKSVQTDQGFIEGWLALGYNKMHKNNFIQALACFQATLKIDPDNAEAQQAMNLLQTEYFSIISKEIEK